jgi:hypothetical protein
MGTSVNGGLRPAWNLGRLLLAGLVLLLASGKIRGPEPDRLATESLAWLYAESTAVLTLWCHQNLAALLVGGMGFALFSLALLLAGDVVRRLVAVVEFLVESELGRRRGRRLGAVAVALGFSLPAAAMLALATDGPVSLGAVLYFVLAYGFICFATDMDNATATIGLYARLRHALAKGCEAERATEGADEFDCH